MKDNPFYQVSGDVVVADQIGPDNYRAWTTHCEEPTYIGDLSFDSEGLLCNELCFADLRTLACERNSVVFRDLNAESANLLISVSL